jgi:hypothetical protein
VLDSATIDRDLRRLEAELKRLEAEYTMYFSGRRARPPWETRSRVEAAVRRYDRAYIPNFGDRFRFATLQTRFMKLTTLWDRGLRAREEGRPGPFSTTRADRAVEASRQADRVLHIAAFRDPAREPDQLRELYEALAEARRETGEEEMPFQKFATLVTSQVDRLRGKGTDRVAFRVMLKGGKVSFTARILKQESRE